MSLMILELLHMTELSLFVHGKNVEETLLDFYDPVDKFRSLCTTW